MNNRVRSGRHGDPPEPAEPGESAEPAAGRLPGRRSSRNDSGTDQQPADQHPVESHRQLVR